MIETIGTCTRCGHVFIVRRESHAEILPPPRCPKCRAYYAVKWSDGPTAAEGKDLFRDAIRRGERP